MESKFAYAFVVVTLIFGIGAVHANPPQRPSGTSGSLSFEPSRPKAGYLDCKAVGTEIIDCTYCQESEGEGVSECTSWIMSLCEYYGDCDEAP